VFQRALEMIQRGLIVHIYWSHVAHLNRGQVAYLHRDHFLLYLGLGALVPTAAAVEDDEERKDDYEQEDNSHNDGSDEVFLAVLPIDQLLPPDVLFSDHAKVEPEVVSFVASFRDHH